MLLSIIKISGYLLKISSNITLVLVLGEMTFGRLELKPLWHCKGSYIIPFVVCVYTCSMPVSLQNLAAYLESHGTQFTSLLAFKPTGWEHSAKTDNLSMIKPAKRGNVTIYGMYYAFSCSKKTNDKNVSTTLCTCN